MRCRPAVLPLFVATLLPWFAYASGGLDPRFDGDGVRVEAIGLEFEALRDVIIDPQGRQVAAGYADTEVVDGVGIVQRLLPGGQRDTSFAGSGVAVILPIDGPTLTLEAIARQPDGKLVVAGNVFDQGTISVQVCRLQVDGSPDPGFANGGCRLVPLWFDSSQDRVHDLALQSDGGIVLLAETDLDPIDDFPDWAVARLLPDGQLDPCFGDAGCTLGGVVIEPESDLANMYVRGVAVDTQDRIVIAGSGRKLPGNSYDQVAVRLLPDGAVDAGFGDDGHRLVDFALGGIQVDSDTANDVALDGDVIYLGGEAYANGGTRAAIARLDANGNLDPAFDGDGRVALIFNDVYPEHRVLALRVQADGKLLVGGIVQLPDFNGFQADCAVARLTTNGTPDPVFAVSGIFAADAGLGLEAQTYDYCQGLASDGRAIALVGYREVGTQYDTLQFRFDEDDLFRDGFEGD